MKNQYNTIDLSKLPAEVQAELKEIFEETEQFNDQKANELYKKNFDFLYKNIQEKYPEAIKKAGSGKKKKSDKKSSKVKKAPKKAIGTRETQNDVEMVLKGHDDNGKEIWVTAEYYEKRKSAERKKSNISTGQGIVEFKKEIIRHIEKEGNKTANDAKNLADTYSKLIGEKFKAGHSAQDVADIILANNEHAPKPKAKNPAKKAPDKLPAKGKILVETITIENIDHRDISGKLESVKLSGTFKSFKDANEYIILLLDSDQKLYVDVKIIWKDGSIYDTRMLVVDDDITMTNRNPIMHTIKEYANWAINHGDNEEKERMETILSRYDLGSDLSIKIPAPKKEPVKKSTGGGDHISECRKVISQYNAEKRSENPPVRHSKTAIITTKLDNVFKTISRNMGEKKKGGKLRMMVQERHKLLKEAQEAFTDLTLVLNEKLHAKRDISGAQTIVRAIQKLTK